MACWWYQLEKKLKGIPQLAKFLIQQKQDLFQKYEVVEFIKLFLNTDTATSTIQVFLKEGVTGEMLECWASHREYELTIHKVLGVPIGDTFQILNQAKLVINYYARLHFGKYLE